MKIFKTILLLFGLATFSIGCKQENYVITCSDGPVSYRLLNNDLNPVAYVKTFDSGDSLTVQVIQNEDALFKHLRFSSLRTKIDFKKETLLFGLIRTHSLGQVIEQRVDSNCAANEIILQTTIKVGGLSATDYVPVFAIVPKISDETRVRIIAKRI